MPTGYEKKEIEQKVKSEWNVDFNALSLTNIVVKYVTVFNLLVSKQKNSWMFSGTMVFFLGIRYLCILCYVHI